MLYLEQHNDSLLFSNYYLYKDKITDLTCFIFLTISVPNNKLKKILFYIDSNVLCDLCGGYLDSNMIYLNLGIKIVTRKTYKGTKTTDIKAIYNEKDEEFQRLIIYLQEQIMLDNNTVMLGNKLSTVVKLINDVLLCIVLK